MNSLSLSQQPSLEFKDFDLVDLSLSSQQQQHVSPKKPQTRSFHKWKPYQYLSHQEKRRLQMREKIKDKIRNVYIYIYYITHTRY
jgi:hypothetical protein